MATSSPARPLSTQRDTSTARRVSWGAIFAGAAVAAALMILFATFGVGIGAAVVDPLHDQNPGSGLGLGSGLYMIITQVLALAAGGYVAARLAGIPRAITSALHGAAVWAIATIFLAWAAVTGAGVMFGAASTVISNTAGAAGNVASAAIPDDVSLPDPSNLAQSLSIDALPQEVQARLREQGITDANLQQEAQAAFRDVFSRQEQQAAMAEARQTLSDVMQSPGDATADISAFFDRLVGGENAIVSEEDRQEAMTQLEQRLGITPEEAQSVVQSVQDNVQNMVDEAQATVEQARVQAVQAAQATTDAISTAALLLSLASLLGLAAACGGAFAGKPQSMVGDRVDDHG